VSIWVLREASAAIEECIPAPARTFGRSLFDPVVYLLRIELRSWKRPNGKGHVLA
jgi:hypothetical protein